MLAQDEGEAGGGLSAEEAALHELPDDEVPYERYISPVRGRH